MVYSSYNKQTNIEEGKEKEENKVKSPTQSANVNTNGLVIKNEVLNKWIETVEKNPTSLTNRRAIENLLSACGLNQFELYERFDEVMAGMINKLSAMVDHNNKKFDPAFEIVNFLNDKFANIYSNLQYYNDSKTDISVKETSKSKPDEKLKTLDSKINDHYIQIKLNSSLDSKDPYEDCDMEIDNNKVMDIIKESDNGEGNGI